MEANNGNLEIFSNENLGKFEFVSYLSLIFIFTLVFTHAQSFQNQLILGTAVNTILFLSAKNITGMRSIMLFIFPSLIAFFSGILFGAQSISLLYMMPFIWIGNYVYVKLAKRIFFNENKLLKGILAPSAIKSAVIFGGAFAMNFLGFIPAQFLVFMGPVQMLTAFLGGAFAIGILKFIRI